MSCDTLASIFQREDEIVCSETMVITPDTFRQHLIFKSLLSPP